MIISNTAELRKYISVNSTFNFETFSPYIQKAINSYTAKYVGQLHVELEQAESSEDSVKNVAREYLCMAIANFAFFLYQPFMQLQIDGSGMTVATSENRKQPEWWQIADVRRELLRSGHEAMDQLLEYLEKNPTIFVDFTDNFSPIYKELIVRNASDFDKCYTIFNSRQTFLALIPTIRQVELQILKNFITSTFIDTIREDVEEDNLKLIKQYIQQAICALTISRVYNEGFFNLDASGIKLKFDILPNESVKQIDYGKPADQLQRAIKIQIDNATQFILLAKELIQEHYPDGLIQTTSIKATTIITDGIIGI